MDGVREGGEALDVGDVAGPEEGVVPAGRRGGSFPLACGIGERSKSVSVTPWPKCGFLTRNPKTI